MNQQPQLLRKNEADQKKKQYKTSVLNGTPIEETLTYKMVKEQMIETLRKTQDPRSWLVIRLFLKMSSEKAYPGHKLREKAEETLFLAQKYENAYLKEQLLNKRNYVG